MNNLPERWTKEDIGYLLEKLNEQPILIADSSLGIPTIHQIKDARHCGFGVFVAETPEYKISFCGGGAMQRTPSGNGWCYLSTPRGEYPYSVDGVRATLEGYLE